MKELNDFEKTWITEDGTLKDGDYVLKPFELLKQQYGLNIDKPAVNSVYCGKAYYTPAMQKIFKDFEIVSVKNTYVHPMPDIGFTITPEMVFGPYMPMGTPIECTDSIGDTWQKGAFVQYEAGSTYTYRVVPKRCEYLVGHFRYIRFPEEKKTPITIGGEIREVSADQMEAIQKILAQD